jgi:nucleotide-binding universal stress UspA family protein
VRYLVALDGSQEAIAGLEWVATLPLTRADEVVLLSVAEPEVQLSRSRRQHERHLKLLLDAAWDARRREAQRLLDHAGSRTSGWVTPVRQVVRAGRPDVEIPRAAESLDADLVVCGPRGRGRIAAILLGSVTRSLLATSRRPLLIARRPITLPDPIVVAVDGSVHGRAVVDCVGRFPWTHGAECVVVVVAARPPVALATSERSLLAEGQRDHAAAIADEAAEALRDAGRAASVSIGEGDAARVIVVMSRQHRAGLVALGTRGAGGLQGRMAGSVAERVVGMARCSVLAVPAAGGGRT